MYSDDDLESAVKAGIFRAEEVTKFRHFVAERSASLTADEEHFRLITGFSDVFVLIACVLSLLSVTWLGGSQSLFIGLLLQTILAWLLAEYFTRIRRMALPSIALLLAFVGGTFGCVLSFLFGGMQLTFTDSPEAIGIAGIAATIAAVAHWFRFKVPITIAAGTATIAAAGVAFLLYQFPSLMESLNLLIFGLGFLIFIFAMAWDISDTARLTRRSDVAFWLHLIAAPLMVHPIFLQLGIQEQSASLGTALITMVLYLFIGVCSLSIDRRALMVSALVYVIYVFNGTLNDYGVVTQSLALTGLVVGSGLLLLSAFWQQCRAALVSRYPVSWQAKLPIYQGTQMPNKA